MAEIIVDGFQRLFEVRLLHHYWLDDGGTVFDLIADPAKRDSRLLKYDSRPWLTVTPTAATARDLSHYRCLFKQSSLGIVVVAPGAAVIPADQVFQFIVSIDDSQFYNYTSLTLRRQKIYELYSHNTQYRYKENVPVLSNLTGASRGVGANKILFLSRENPPPTVDDSVESLVQSGGALLQLTGDNPGATTYQLNAVAANLPVYMHQADSPAIAPPAGVTGVPARGVSLSADVTDDVSVLISLTAVRGNDADFSFIDGAGHSRSAPPIYQVRFKNRITIWRYLNKSTGAIISTEANPLPLTYFGNAGTKQKPSGSFVKAEMGGTKVTRLISEVFI